MGGVDCSAMRIQQRLAAVIFVMMVVPSVTSVLDCRTDNTTAGYTIQIANQIGGRVKVLAAQSDHVGYIVCIDGLPPRAQESLLISTNTTYVLFAFKAPNSGEDELWPVPGSGYPAAFNITDHRGLH